ncbi:MAG: PSD1 and planctomycete cytochrome C domain-containing protein [Planctomycetota bacterium]
MHKRSILLSLAFLSACTGLVQEAASSDLGEIDFARDVRPILSDNCFHCHGPDAANQESPFRADSEEHLLEDLGGYAGVVPGDPNESELYLRIMSDDEFSLMPPPDSHRVLTEREKRILKAWIEQGAQYEGHWAFQRVNRPKVPEHPGDSSGNPIDAFVLQRLAAEGLKPSPRAEPSVLLRRVSLTLTGLLPSERIQQEFLRDPNEESFGRAVDQLIALHAFAERQTLRWLDAARYADTDGYQKDSERTNWPWRDWVTKSFHENMPFDQFTIEQLAGDMLENATDLQRLASAFNRNHRQNAEGGALADEFLVENVIDRVETTSTVWMGLTMGCARCHDHKYDPLSQKEFYQLYGYFNNIGEKGIGQGVDSNPLLKSFSPLVDVPKKLHGDLLLKEEQLKKSERGLADRESKWVLEARRELERQETSVLDSEVKSEGDGRLTSEASSPIDVAELSDRLKEVLLKEPSGRTKKDKDQIRAHFKKIDPEYSTARKQVGAIERQLVAVAGPRVKVMVMNERRGDPRPAYLLDRGQYDAPDKSEALSRAVPTALMTRSNAKQPSNRLELARWLVSRDNPLTARVIVNRIWQDHFGIGLVKTSEDFGVQGDSPSHPKLLDWLAAEFMESGWDVKAIHRLIVTSQTYCQQSHVNESLSQLDPENRLLARGPRYRADGFVIRDVVLQTSDLLNTTVGGPPVKPYQPVGLWATLATRASDTYKESSGEDLYRKSLYTYWKRAVNPPRQIIFDSGGREVCDVKVRRTNTPLQALVLLNDPTMIEAARNLAERAIKDCEDPEKQLSVLYQRAMARQPNPRTLVVLNRNQSFFSKHFGLHREEASAFLSIGQSGRDSSIDIQEHAALASVAHLILNLDEFITIE